MQSAYGYVLQILTVCLNFHSWCIDVALETYFVVCCFCGAFYFQVSIFDFWKQTVNFRENVLPNIRML